MDNYYNQGRFTPPMYPNNYRTPYPNVNTNKYFVDGINDVYNKQLPGGSDYIFIDSKEDILYQKIVDMSGKCEVKTFDIVPRSLEKSTNFVSRQEFDELKSYIKTIEEYLPKVNTQGGTDDGTKRE